MPRNQRADRAARAEKKKKKKGPFSSRDPVVEAVCQKGNKKKRAHLVVPFSNTG